MKAEGAAELRRALRAADRELRLGINREIKPAAQLVAEQARRNAIAAGFGPPGKSGRGTGVLLRGIKPSVRSGIGFVRESALSKDGFPYPAVYEFGRGKVRAFLVPAVDQKREAVKALISGAVDRALAHQNLT